jgi:hypothetical protein
MGLGCRFKGTLENRSMAGVVEQDSIHMNIQNPASYASNLKHNFRWYVCDSNLKNATEPKLQEQH